MNRFLELRELASSNWTLRSTISLDQTLEPIADHDQFEPPAPVSRRKTSRYFFPGLRHHVHQGSDGTGGCLFQWMRSR